MSSDMTGAGATSVTIGRIVVTGDGTGFVDPRYLTWMQAAVSARTFAERFAVGDSEYALRGCRLEIASSPREFAELSILVDIRPLGLLSGRTTGRLRDVLAVVCQWIETSLAILVENTSVGEPEAVPPARLELHFGEDLGDAIVRAFAVSTPGKERS